MKKDEEREVLEVVLEVLEVFLEVSCIVLLSMRWSSIVDEMNYY